MFSHQQRYRINQPQNPSFSRLNPQNQLINTFQQQGQYFNPQTIPMIHRASSSSYVCNETDKESRIAYLIKSGFSESVIKVCFKDFANELTRCPVDIAVNEINNIIEVCLERFKQQLITKTEFTRQQIDLALSNHDIDKLFDLGVQTFGNVIVDEMKLTNCSIPAIDHSTKIEIELVNTPQNWNISAIARCLKTANFNPIAIQHIEENNSFLIRFPRSEQNALKEKASLTFENETRDFQFKIPEVDEDFFQSLLSENLLDSTSHFIRERGDRGLLEFAYRKWNEDEEHDFLSPKSARLVFIELHTRALVTKALSSPSTPMEYALAQSYPKFCEVSSQSMKNQTFTVSFKSTKVTVIESDPFSIVNDMKHRGLNPCLLTTKDQNSTVSLLCRSNFCLLYDSIDSEIVSGDCHHTTGITFFRDNNFDFCETFYSDIIFISSIAFSGQDIRVMLNQIENAIKLSLRCKYDAIVVASVACNSPNNIAFVFKAIITKYAGAFKELIFGIVGSHSNLTAFRQAFHDSCISSSCSSVIAHSKCSGLNCPLISASPVEEKEVHKLCFSHHCDLGGLCVDNSKDHRSMWFHPELECSNGKLCQRIDNDHLQEFLHLPVCPSGLSCPQYHLHNHNMRHLKMVCNMGNSCIRFWDSSHLLKQIHQFIDPCKELINCTNASQSHMSSFSHICIEGDSCRQINDEKHCKLFIHIKQAVCEKGVDCECLTDEFLNEEHLNALFHPGIPQIRPLCSDGSNCISRNAAAHTKLFRHPSLPLPSCEFLTKFNQTDFEDNALQMIQQIHKHPRFQPNGIDFERDNAKEIIEFVSSLHPVHKCKVGTFNSILRYFNIVASDEMSSLTEFFHIQRTVRSYCDLHISKMEPDKRTVLDCFSDELIRHSIQKDAVSSTLEQMKKQAIMSCGLKQVLFVEDITRNIINQSTIIPGQKFCINYDVDKIFGTNQQVFSVLGLHTADYYGNCTFILDRSILFHPNTFITVCAATSYYTGRFAPPWTPLKYSDSTSDLQKIEQFQKHCLSAASPSFVYALAAHLLGRTAIELNIDPSEVSLIQVKNWWEKYDAHAVFECHLPAQVPLSFVKKILILRSDYKLLNQEQIDSLQCLREILPKDSIQIIEGINPESLQKELLKQIKKHSNRVSASKYPQIGFSFALNNDIRDVLKGTFRMPLPFTRSSESHSLHLYLKVSTNDSIQFSLMDASSNQACFCIDFKRGITSINVAGNLLGSSLQFTKCMMERELLYIHIWSDHKKRQLGIERVGSSAVFNDTKLSFDYPRFLDIDLFQCVEVTPSGESQFENFVISFSRIDSLHSRDIKPFIFPQKKKHAPEAPVVVSSNPPNNRVACPNGINCSAFTEAFTTQVHKIEELPSHLLSHFTQYSHTCRYDKRECSALLQHPKSTHSLLIDHVSLPQCQEQACRHMHDPFHREHFFHQGKPNKLFPCRFGKNCKDITVPKHLFRYSHYQ